MKSLRGLGLLLAALWMVGTAVAQETTNGGYKVLRKIHLDGDGGWDYLKFDNDGRRLYVDHNNSVQVLDGDTLKLIGTVEKVQHPHGVALVPELGKGYASSGDPGSVVVFDLKTLKTIAEIPSSKDTDVITYDPASGYVFTFNGDSGNSTVIDPKTDKVVQVLDLGGKPEFAVPDGKGYLYDNLESKDQVIRINTKTLKIEKRWKLKPDSSPCGMALDLDHNRIFVGCHNKTLVVLDAQNGKVIQELPIGDHIDATYFDPASQTVFNSCGDGTLSVIHEDSPDQYSVLENAATELGARTMAFDPQTGHAFSATAQMEAPPTPTQDDPKPRRRIVPGTFEILVIGK